MNTTKLLCGSLLLGVIALTAPSTNAQQAQTETDTTATDTRDMDYDRDDDDGFDWGLLGLLGLLGLIPRKHKDVVVHRDDANRNNPNNPDNPNRM